MLGGALGLGLTDGALRQLVDSKLTHLPRIDSISIDAAVVAFAFVTSIAAGIAFGVMPVFKYARPHVADTLRGAGRSMSQSRERHRIRGALVVVQVALAMVLLVGSGLMIRTFQTLRAVDPGISRPEQVQVLRVAIPESQVEERERVVRVQEEMLRSAQSLAGVSSAAIASSMALQGGSSSPV